MAKYIFITGGVVSSLGKGIASASIGKLLEARGLKVNIIKCPEYVEALEKMAYDKNGQPDKTSGFDHITDAAGYFIYYEYPLKQKRTFKVKAH